MESILFLIFWILAFLVYFGAIISITRSRFIIPVNRTVWLLIVLFIPVVGSVLYFLNKKKYTTKETRKFQPNFNRE